MCLRNVVPLQSDECTSKASEKNEMEDVFDVRNVKYPRRGQTLYRPTKGQVLYSVLMSVANLQI